MHADLHARTPRYSDFPSMKTVKNVDDKFKNKLPSTKTARIMDGSPNSDVPSTKTAKNVDGRSTSVFVKLLIISVFVL